MGTVRKEVEKKGRRKKNKNERRRERERKEGLEGKGRYFRAYVEITEPPPHSPGPSLLCPTQ